MSVYYDNDKSIRNGLGTKVGKDFTIVSGGKGASSAPRGIYENLKPEATKTSSNSVLSDKNHGGGDNIMIRLPDTGGCAIHQGHNLANESTAYTEGCVAVTVPVNSSTLVNSEYQDYVSLLEPSITEGVPINVEIK